MRKFSRLVATIMKTSHASRQQRTASSLERLEGRIAPATLINPTTVTYHDLDGDLVTVKTSVGTFDLASQFTFFSMGSGELLAMLKLNDPGFQGATITITAKTVAGTGDGSVNVGTIASSNDLAGITVDGDLNSAAIGDSSVGTLGLGLLHASSLGRTNQTLSSSGITVFGGLGALNIAHRVNNVVVLTTTATPSDIGIGSVAIGGSMLGAAGLVTSGTIGSVKIGGDVSLVGVGSGSGRIQGATIGNVTIGGDFTAIAVPAGPAVSIGADSGLGLVTIGGDVRGTTTIPAMINVFAGNLTGVRIGGSLYNGIIGTNSAGSVGDVHIGGDIVAAQAAGPAIFSAVDLGAVSVRGSLISDGEGGSIGAGHDLASVKIGGNVRVFGGHGGVQGGARIFANGALGNVVIGGSLDAGGSVDDLAGSISAASIAGIKIKGYVQGGSGVDSAGIFAGGPGFGGGPLGAVNIGGSVRGGAGNSSASIQAAVTGPVKIGGSLVTGMGDSSASLHFTSVAAPGLSIGGSIDARAAVTDAPAITMGGTVLTVKGSILGNNGIGGRVEAGVLDKLTVGHSIVNTSGIKITAGVGAFKVGGSIRGFSPAAPLLINVLFGNAGVAIGSFAVKGDVENTNLLAGTLPGSIVNAVTIGSVTVGGDWIASNLAVSTLPGNDGKFGTADDAGLSSGSSIGSIVIGGVGEGTLFVGGDSFGIVASEIDSLKINGKTFALTAGAHNDTDPTLAAHNIGWSLDFTVHET